MREREEKRVQNADASVLLKKISERGDSLTFKESVQILNDISYLVVSVDQNKAEFKTLIKKIKSDLQADGSLTTQHNFELVEALCRMRIESLSDLMREMIVAKKLSRKTKDISVQLLYFGNLLATHKLKSDLGLIIQLVQELKFLEITELQAEHINFLMEAFSQIAEAISADPVKFQDSKEELGAMISEFLPRMLEHGVTELYRNKLGDVLTIVKGYEKLADSGIISADSVANAHKHCEIYLDAFLDKTKRVMNGKEFAELIKSIGDAKLKGVYTYNQTIVGNLEREFVSYQAENSHF